MGRLGRGGTLRRATAVTFVFPVTSGAVLRGGGLVRYEASLRGAGRTAVTSRDAVQSPIGSLQLQVSEAPPPPFGTSEGAAVGGGWSVSACGRWNVRRLARAAAAPEAPLFSLPSCRACPASGGEEGACGLARRVWGRAQARPLQTGLPSQVHSCGCPPVDTNDSQTFQ